MYYILCAIVDEKEPESLLLNIAGRLILLPRDRSKKATQVNLSYNTLILILKLLLLQLSFLLCDDVQSYTYRLYSVVRSLYLQQLKWYGLLRGPELLTSTLRMLYG